MATLTWLGHAAFRLESDRGKHIYVDPFLTGNPKTPGEREDARARRRDRASRTATATTSATPSSSRSASRTPRSSARSSSRAGSAGRARNVGDSCPGSTRAARRTIDGIRFTLIERVPLVELATTGEYLGEACGIVIRSRTACRSTSPATPASSATCS